MRVFEIAILKVNIQIDTRGILYALNTYCTKNEMKFLEATR